MKIISEVYICLALRLYKKRLKKFQIGANPQVCVWNPVLDNFFQ